ncbi:MAG: SLBB domain-containing protein [Candidatus Aegiribacteria sp.]|nr:SLBB domain-containing protein [Candidatus Aegiribacteria sp.]
MVILLLMMIYNGVSEEFLPTQPMIEEIDPAEYVVGPGDILWFSLQGGIPPELSGSEAGSIIYITVTPDGYAVIPSAGAWPVAGLSLYEAANLIEAGFTSKYPGLRGMGGLAAIRMFRVPITGQVVSQGMYNVNGASRLTDLLNKAGGIAPAGSWTAIQIVSSDGDTTEVDITEFLLNGCMQSNPVLSLGDRVHVPQAEEFISIEGAVNLSGSFSTEFHGAADQAVWSGSSRGMIEYIPGETVSCFVKRIGGTRTWAARDSCYILRVLANGEEERIRAPLDIPSIDPELLPGDIVVCPGIPPVVAVTGFVYSPGVYPHIAGMGAFYYISQAGGFLREASGSGTRVVLADGREELTEDVSAIPPGSVISVPRKVIVGWQDPLLIFTSIASIIIAWKSLD